MMQLSSMWTIRALLKVNWGDVSQAAEFIVSSFCLWLN